MKVTWWKCCGRNSGVEIAVVIVSWNRPQNFSCLMPL